MASDFARLYAAMGRPSIAPEKLLRAMLLQAFYSIRSERQLMERLEFDLLFRWFVGLGIDEAAWDHSTFSKNRDRLLEGAVAARFLSVVLHQPRVKRLLSTEHFSVDGTLVEAWASMKSFKPVDEDPNHPSPPVGRRNLETDFRGERRSNTTHASTTDPEARLYRKGHGMEARLCFLGHALMENRSGLLVDACVTPADGHAERVAALAMMEPRIARSSGSCSCSMPATARSSPGRPWRTPLSPGRWYAISWSPPSSAGSNAHARHIQSNGCPTTEVPTSPRTLPTSRALSA